MKYKTVVNQSTGSVFNLYPSMIVNGPEIALFDLSANIGGYVFERILIMVWHLLFEFLALVITLTLQHWELEFTTDKNKIIQPVRLKAPINILIRIYSKSELIRLNLWEVLYRSTFFTCNTIK
jgi:hypothetical protein